MLDGGRLADWLCGVANTCGKRRSASPPEACRWSKIRVEVLDEACVDIRLMGVLAVGLPVSAWVVAGGSREWGVFWEACTHARKSR